MPENEFEKKVSAELQGLKFKPSETVWMKVEERIREKKKRRVFIIFFLFAGIALLGYWQWDNIFGGKKNEIAKTETTGQEKSNTTNNIDQNITEDNKQDDRTTEAKTTIKNKNNNEVQKPIVVDKPVSKINNISSKNDNPPEILTEKNGKVSVGLDQKEKKSSNAKRNSIPDRKRKVNLTESDLADIKVNQPASAKDASNVKNANIGNVKQDDDQKIDKQGDVKADVAKPDSNAKKDDLKKDSVIKKADTVSRVIPVDSPIVSIPKKSTNTNKKWKFGIEFIPGYSSFHESFLFSLNMSKSAVAYSSPGSVNAVAPSGPVKSHSGFAFQFGGFFKKQFTQRSGFTVGLRWAYYSEQLRIGGSMVPASQSPAFQQLLNALGTTRAYDAGGLNFYETNKYHFIELPVNYNVRINNNEAHPLNLQAGLKIGQMFTSNALVYDTVAGGIYYGSKKYFNKTQFGITTSLTWKITKKDKFYMAVGPAFDMHFNSLMDNPLDKKKYLLFAGLRTSVLFNSKK